MTSLFVALAICILIIVTEVQSEKQITQFVEKKTKYTEMGPKKGIGLNVAAVNIKLITPKVPKSQTTSPVVLVEICPVDSHIAFDNVFMTIESYNFQEDDNEKSTSTELTIANLIQIPKKYPLTVTYKMNGRYKGAACVRRTYTDGVGRDLPMFAEETLSVCPF